MGLLSWSYKPYIATKDLVVLKTLIREEGEYKTPWIKNPIKLNSMLVAEGDEDKELISGMTRVTKGFVHAHTIWDEVINEETEGCFMVKAIIPKGTEYYINIHFKDVCAKRMFITDEIVMEHVDEDEQLERMVDLFEPILDVGNYNTYGIPCYFLCSNSYFYSLRDVPDGVPIVGVITNMYRYWSYSKEDSINGCHVLYLNGKEKLFDYVKDRNGFRVAERRRPVCA